MANFEPSKKQSSDFNNGNEYRNKVDSVTADDLNNIIEYLLYLGNQNVVTIDEQQTITAQKTFTAPIMVLGEGYNNISINPDGYIDISNDNNSQYPISLNSRGITIQDRDLGNSYTKFFPEIGTSNETFATREWANSQYESRIDKNARNIQSLMAMQAKTVMEQTLTDSYTARQTADGALNIVDGALTYPTKISGKTVKTINLIDDSYFINKPLGSGFTGKRIPFKIASGTYTAIIKTKNVTKIQANVTTLTLMDSSGNSIISILNTGLSSNTNSFNNAVTFTVTEEQAKVIEKISFFFNSTTGTDYIGDEIAYIMLNEGTSIKPYSPYFNGLKHAYFKGVRSIGRQLLDRNDFTIIDGNKYAYSVKALSLEKNYYIAANSAVIKYVKISVNTWSEWNVSFGSDWGSDYKQKAYFTTTKYGMNSTKPLTFDGKYIYIWVVDTANGVNRLATPEDIEKYEIMIYEGASDDYAYEEYKDDTSFAYTEAQELKEWDYLLPQEGKKVEQTAVITSETEFTDEQIAQYADYILSEDRKTLAYKTATETETDLKPEKSSYFAYKQGQEIVDEGDTENSLYEANVEIEQDYYVWIGGEE